MLQSRDMQRVTLWILLLALLALALPGCHANNKKTIEQHQQTLEEEED